MDAKTNESSPTISPHPQCDVDRSQMRNHGHVSGETEAPNLFDPSPVECQVARVLVCVSETREAKIRALQEAVKSDTYHVTAEQLADKMLRETLRELCS
jgi:anti-sigma28 factor (negative regulator of flagellin synthesis)